MHAAAQRVDTVRLKRLGRYLKGEPRVVEVFAAPVKWDGELRIRIMVDSDNAGDIDI